MGIQNHLVATRNTAARGFSEGETSRRKRGLSLEVSEPGAACPARGKLTCKAQCATGAARATSESEHRGGRPRGRTGVPRGTQKKDGARGPRAHFLFGTSLSLPRIIGLIVLILNMDIHRADDIFFTVEGGKCRLVKSDESLRCFWMLVDRHVTQLCAGMFRRPVKHGEGRQGGPRMKDLQMHTHSEARHERHQRCSHAKYRAQHAMHARQRSDVEQITTAAFNAGSPKEVYLCIDDTRATYLQKQKPLLGHCGHLGNPWYHGSILLSVFGRSMWAKDWEAEDRDARGLWPITKWTYGDGPKEALKALCRFMIDTEVLTGIVGFRLEHRRVDCRRRFIGAGPFAKGEAEVDACVLVPKDDRVKFYIYGMAEAWHASVFWLKGERPPFRDRRVGVLYEGTEVAIIEEGCMRATKGGIRLQTRKCAHDLHRMDEASRLHESRLCLDLFAQVMAYVG